MKRNNSPLAQIKKRNYLVNLDDKITKVFSIMNDFSVYNVGFGCEKSNVSSNVFN